MTQKSIKTFVEEIYSEPPKKKYPTNETDAYHIDDIWSLDVLDLKNYGPENNRGHRYTSVVIDNFSKLAWTVPLKNKNAQTKKDSFENSFVTWKRKPILFESDRGKKFFNSILQNFLNNKNLHYYSRITFLGTVFAERINRTIKDLLKGPVFEKGEGN